MIDVKDANAYSHKMMDTVHRARVENLIRAICKTAIDDYINCIQRGGAYLDCVNIGTKSQPVYDSGIFIVKDVCTGVCGELYDIEVLEKIFKEVDAENEYWFKYYYGRNWVHPWDACFGYFVRSPYQYTMPKLRKPTKWGID